MPAKITYAEPHDQYLLDNYQEMSLTEMCANLNIDIKVGKRVLKKLGIVRSQELTAKFRGHRKPCEARDTYFKENYLKKPLKHICKDQGVSVKMGERILKRLGLVRPPELILKFKTTHTNAGVKPKTKKSRYTPIKKITKAPKKKLKVDALPKVEKVFPNKVIDYSTKIMVKIDNKTWVYRDKKA